MADFINEELFAKQIRTLLNEEMTKAAEPLLKKAVADIEAEMRKRLAAMLVGVLDTSYSAERDGRVMAIRVALGKGAVDGQ
jgi:hypothetical protein